MKGYFSKSKMLFTEEEIRKVKRMDAAMYGFALITIEANIMKDGKPDYRLQNIFAFTTDQYRACNWVKNNSPQVSCRYAVVAGINC